MLAGNDGFVLNNVQTPSHHSREYLVDRNTEEERDYDIVDERGRNRSMKSNAVVIIRRRPKDIMTPPRNGPKDSTARQRI